MVHTKLFKTYNGTRVVYYKCQSGRGSQNILNPMKGRHSDYDQTFRNWIVYVYLNESSVSTYLNKQ